MALIVQMVCSAIICCICVCTGIMFAWPSSTILLFESNSTTLDRPMTDTELSLFGSLSSVGALVGTPIIGLLLDRIGRKNSAILASLMGVIAWAMVAFFTQVEVLLAAMFICGLGGAVFLAGPVYVGEICEESIRGAMIAGVMVVNGFGMLVSYVLGGCLEYHTMTYISLSLAIMVTLLMPILKESPIYLMGKGREMEAAASIAFYRSAKPDSIEVIEEINVIKRAFNPRMDGTLSEEEMHLNPTAETAKKLSLWSFLKQSSSTRRGISLTLIMTTASILQGLVVIQVYAEPVFVEAIPTMSPTLGSTLLAVVSIASGIVGAVMTEYAGRRPLMIYGSFVTGASCLLLGLQIHLRWGPDWLTAVNMYCFTVVYSLGAGTVPYILIAEVFLPEVRSVLSMMVVEWVWICNSIVLFLYNPLMKAIGLGPIFYLFALVGIFSGVYSIFYLPETKGLTVNAIQELLSKKRVTSVRPGLN